MLTQLDITHFKCFDLLRLPLGPLTLLSGSNASGKSSVLQSLVLLHQTMREHEWSTRLMLNGGAIRLGTVSDVVDKVHGRRSFEIGVTDESHSYQWTFGGERSEMSMEIESIVSDGEKTDKPEVLRYLLPQKARQKSSALADRIRGLSYITAERVGPREVYPLEDRQIAPGVGPAGEHAVCLLHLGRDEKVVKDLVIEGVPNTRLRQVEARMQSFFPGCAIDVQQVPQANAVTLGIRTSEDTDFHRPIHVGFGLTQVLPIVVAALSSKERDILLIENPEVHLHPAGQASMGQFLAEVSRSGIQVIVETHSDHVLNGIRRAVKANRLRPEQVTIHFFKPRSEPSPQVLSPQIDTSGNLDAWPEGFFDQFDKDASYFAGWGA